MFYVKRMRAGELPLTKHAGSMALDIEAGATTELEGMTGFIVERARQHGIPVPSTGAVYALAKGLEYAAALRRQEQESAAR
jgi:2-dehydropantoate 2-reductase